MPPSWAGQSASRGWRQIYHGLFHHGTHTTPMMSAVFSHITHLLAPIQHLVQ